MSMSQNYHEIRDIIDEKIYNFRAKILFRLSKILVFVQKHRFA